MKEGVNYFLTSLTFRFDHVNEHYSTVFSKFFGGSWEPIYLYQNFPAKHFEKTNYLVINRKLSGTKNQVIGLENEDLNLDLNSSPAFRKVVKALRKRQGKVYYTGFTNCFLNPSLKLKFIGPNSSVTTYLDNKRHQFRLFDKLKLSSPKHKFYRSIKSVMSKESFPYHITTFYSSGGSESSFIHSKDELMSFYSRLRSYTKNGFVVSEIIDNVITCPNSTAIVLQTGKVNVLAVSDQILCGNSYLGNTSPAKISTTTSQQICKMTKLVGLKLAKKGYRGLFGCDFMVTNSALYINDLNPRRQGGYGIINFIQGNEGLVENEVIAALNLKHAPKYKLGDSIYSDKVFAHTKIRYFDNSHHFIDKEIYRNTIENRRGEINGSLCCSFYKKDSEICDTFPGYYASFDNNDALRVINNPFIKIEEIRQDISH